MEADDLFSVLLLRSASKHSFFCCVFLVCFWRVLVVVVVGGVGVVFTRYRASAGRLPFEERGARERGEGGRSSVLVIAP